jgi:hypothetical protein
MLLLEGHVPETTVCSECAGLSKLKSFVCPVWEPREHNRVIGERVMYYYQCLSCEREFYNKAVSMYNDAKTKEIIDNVYQS